MKRGKRAKSGAKGAGKFDQANEVRAIARERLGTVKASQPILPKTSRKKPKHKKSIEQSE